MAKMSLEDRVPAVSTEEFYNRAADKDSRPVPQFLRESRPFEGKHFQVPVDRFFSKEYHDREVEHLWKKVWQFTCREDEIPNVGDVYLYEVATLQYFLVRSAPDRIKAYVNSCPHRGRKIVDHDGVTLEKLRCPFHGFEWDLDGRNSMIPCAWDFSHIEDSEYWHLSEAQVDVWAGSVFINPDPDAGSLMAFLNEGGDIDEHYGRYGFDDRYIIGHARKVVPCNWKVAQEAFFEAFHIVGTHPQLTLTGCQTDIKYDVFGNFGRGLGVYYTPNRYAVFEPSEQQIVDSALDLRLDSKQEVIVPEGRTAREQMAIIARQGYERTTGESADKFADTEMVDVCFMSIFPNFHPWALFARICYHFRPYKDDPNRSWMDIYQLGLYDKSNPRPKSAKVRMLSDDESFGECEEINAYLGRIANQDAFNFGPLQEGLKTSAKGVVTYSNYQESRCRDFHEKLDKWLGE